MRARAFLVPGFARAFLLPLLVLVATCCSAGSSECPPPLPRQEPGELVDGAKLPRLVANEIILPRRQASFWNVYYPHVVTLINAAYRGVDPSTPLHIVEIGTAYGGLADHLMTAFPGATFTTIDPFILGYDDGDTHSKKMAEFAKIHNLTLAQLSDAWSLALTNLQTAKHGCRYRALRMLSSEAASRKVLTPGSIDVLFIDGLHTYEGVRQVHAQNQRIVPPRAPAMFTISSSLSLLFFSPPPPPHTLTLTTTR